MRMRCVICHELLSLTHVALQFLNQRNWQSWILPFLIDGDSGAAVIRGNGAQFVSVKSNRVVCYFDAIADTDTATFRLALTLLGSLLFEYLCTPDPKDGDKPVQNVANHTVDVRCDPAAFSVDTLGMQLIIKTAGWTPQVASAARLVLMSLLRQIKAFAA